MYKTTSLGILMMMPLSAAAQSGFPEGFDASAGGISIGDSSAQVQHVFEENFINFDDAEPNPDSKMGEPWKIGYKMEAGEDVLPSTGEVFLTSQGAAEATRAQAFGSRNKYTGQHISVTYGSPLSGNVVEAVKRSQNFDPPLDFRAALQAVGEKYGEPHGGDGGGRMLYYAFKNGNPIETADKETSAKEIRMRCLQPGSAPRNVVSKAYSGGSYTLAINRTGQDFFGPIERRTFAAEEHCDAVMTVSIKLDRNRLVTNMEIYMLDIAMMAADQMLTQTVVPEPVKPIGSTDVPKL